jgi:hypothetical protein
MVQAREDLYFSADTETDGPAPGTWSMLSFGLAVAGTYDGRTFTRADPEALTFYRELRPISEHFEDEAVAVSGLDRDRLVAEGPDPADAMREAAAWVLETAGDRRPVFVAYPLGFDWMFMQWYFVNFTGDSPFSYASALDIKTIYQQRSGAVLDETSRANLPPELRPEHPHTHNALDDAIEQGELLANLLEWGGPGGATGRR